MSPFKMATTIRASHPAFPHTSVYPSSHTRTTSRNQNGIRSMPRKGYETPKLKRTKVTTRIGNGPYAHPPQKKPATARKACKLDWCSKKLGDCMHCTCDGSCGQHAMGKCGERREGSGPGCKKAGCTKDDNCTHSTRASCCHCRNLVFSLRHRSSSTENGSKASGNRRSGQETGKAKKDNSGSRGSNDGKPARKRAKSSRIESSNGKKSLIRRGILQNNELWNARRSFCNMAVVVEGTIFHLHKYPVLMKCSALHKVIKYSGMSYPFIQIHEFPGGIEMFEKLMDHCYSGQKMVVTPSNAASMHCAAELLGMDFGKNNVISQLREFLTSRLFIMETPTSFMNLQTLFSNLVKVGPLLESSGKRLLTQCVRRISNYLAHKPKALISLPLDPDEFDNAVLVTREEGITEDLLSRFVSSYIAGYISRINVGLVNKCRALCELLGHIRAPDAVSSSIGTLILHGGIDLQMKSEASPELQSMKDKIPSACIFAAELL